MDDIPALEVNACEMPEVDCPCLPMDWGCPLCVLDDSAYITSNTREDN